MSLVTDVRDAGVPGWNTPGLTKLFLALLPPLLFNRGSQLRKWKFCPFTCFWDIPGCACSFPQSPQGRATPLRVTLLHVIPTSILNYLQAICSESVEQVYICKGVLTFVDLFDETEFWWEYYFSINPFSFQISCHLLWLPQYFYSLLPPRVGGLPDKGYKCPHLCGKIDSLFTRTRSEAFEYER